MVRDTFKYFKYIKKPKQFLKNYVKLIENIHTFQFLISFAVAHLNLPLEIVLLLIFAQLQVNLLLLSVISHFVYEDPAFQNFSTLIQFSMILLHDKVFGNLDLYSEGKKMY